MAWKTPRCVARFCADVLPVIARAADGRRMLGLVERIMETDRWSSFDRFHETAERIAAAYEESGAAARLHAIRTGGPVGSGGWIIREAEDIRSASIEVVRPVRMRVAEYATNPWTVIGWGASTPPRGLTAELAVVDSAEDMEQLHPGALAGKTVLTRLDPRKKLKFEELVRRGAVAVISDMPVRGHQDATKWMRFGFGGIAVDLAACRIAGFMVPEVAGRRLRALVKRHGAVSMRVKADVRDYIGSHDVVSGVVLGRDDPQDEVWALAHAYEPGALDNASGVAVCVEIARVLESLIRSGELPRPRRSIRLLNGYECFGFFGYLAEVRRWQTPLAGACIDSVGARPAVCEGRMQWHATTPMCAGFAEHVGAAVLRATLRLTNPGYRLVRKGFMSTPDTLIGDPKYGFPCPYLSTDQTRRGQYDAYHSSADTLSILSARGLAACAAGMAGYLYFLADAATPEVLELAAAETQFALGALPRGRRKARAAQARFVADAHQASLARLGRWLWGGERRAILERFAECRRRVEDAARRAVRHERKRRVPPDARLVPHRKILLTPLLENAHRATTAKIESAKLPSWALYWADGTRNLAEIADAVSCERNQPVTAGQVAKFFEAHAELGYAALVRPDEMVTEAQLVADLRRLGVRRGMDVIMHIALSKVGYVAGGPDAMIDAVLKAIGRTGTLVMPSFNHRDAYVFNPLATRTKNGAVADAFWRRTDAVRSVQATHPVAAIGPKAAELCRGHLETRLWGQDSPIGRVIHGGGYVLSVGVTQSSSTAYHVAEDSVPAPCLEPFLRTDRVVMPDGSVRRVRGLGYRNVSCPVPTAAMQKGLERRGLIRHGKVGRADAMLVKAHDIWRMQRELIRKRCATCAIRPPIRMRRPLTWPDYLKED